MTIGSESQFVSPVAGLRGRMLDLLRRRASWVMIDQAIVSAGSFLTANLLGRQLSTEQFGVFGLIFETMMYLNSLQNALVIYPLTMKGAIGERAHLGRVASFALVFTCLLLPVLGLATGGAVVAAGSGGVAIAAIAAMFLWQIQETLRRALIADLRVSETIAGDAVSYLGQAALIAIMWPLGWVTLNSTFLVIGLTSAAAIVIQAWQVKLARVHLHELPTAAREFWRLGRWMFPAYASGILTSLGFWWTLKWTHSAADCGIFYAITNALKLANPVMSSLSGLIVPAVARSLARQGASAARGIALRYVALGAALLAPYFLLLVMFPSTTLGVLYGWQSPYRDYAILLQLFVGTYALNYIETMAGVCLAGMGLTRWNFYGQAIKIIMALSIGLPLTYVWGVTGLVVGHMIVTASGAFALVYFVWRANRRMAITS